MQLEKVQGKSKKTGKPYTAYVVKIGKFRTPLFFPSEIELEYIEKRLKNKNKEDFWGDEEDAYDDES